MSASQSHWQLLPPVDVPSAFLEAVKQAAPQSDGKFAAQLLWQRGIRDLEALPGFLNADCHQPTSPFEFGQEMKRAVQRLLHARETGEKVTIWGDFDADGVTSTSVLWDGLGQFFPQHLQLDYYIPNRFTESHGLNLDGIERLAAAGTRLIVTCDTGSTNLAEIDAANRLGLDIIVTDHHTLPDERPDVVAMINPRYFSESHPLYHLSGVAVAYKLVEAMYATLPNVPQYPLEDLLDLVAIGLIADLVQLSGDCRYLAQRGIEQLQRQLRDRTRPGVAKLLELCQRSGDRPTDISFGLGPRINAVSRIHGDARFCVELLTSRDRDRCDKLAMETELANTRRKELQKNVTDAVKRKLEQVDLSTTSVIVLDDPQWSGGVLGLVAGQIAQECGRPCILLNTEAEFARGSARSANNIDLYELVRSQAHLLHRFGGHPFAAGLSLPLENLELFRDAINQQLRQKIGDPSQVSAVIQADLEVTVADLGQALFRELKLLEPCGMGNPVPKLLIQNCWFERVWNKNIQDYRGNKVKYIRTFFNLADETNPDGFPGVWWGHPQEDIPKNEPCDVIVELDFNTYRKGYEVRLVAVRSRLEHGILNHSTTDRDRLLDFRGSSVDETEIPATSVLLNRCPSQWDDVQQAYRRATRQTRPLALTYHAPETRSRQQVWTTLVGIAKYLSRTEKTATWTQLEAKLNLSRSTLEAGLEALQHLGFSVQTTAENIHIRYNHSPRETADAAIQKFLDLVAEEQFQRQYFYRVPITTLREMVTQTRAW
jgi:single-stranded-DNA-specific exonuclease